MVLEDHRPDCASQFVRDKLLEQMLSFVFKRSRKELLVVQILVYELLPDGTLIFLELRVLPFPGQIDLIVLHLGLQRYELLNIVPLDRSVMLVRKSHLNSNF